MNIKIFNRLQEMLKASPALLMNPQSLKVAISATFDVTVDAKANSIVELTNTIDTLVLEQYFSKVWQPQTKKYKYSGLSIIDEINSLEPANVLDLGCGYNEFKGKINNLIGIDPYNTRADVNSTIMDYVVDKDKEYDVVISLGSINFGSSDKILMELSHAIELTSDKGLLFFRVNPGKMHTAPEAEWIDFFEWTPEFIINAANAFGCMVVTIRQDNGRIFFVLKKR